jgi:hypothetical protein
MRNDPKNEVLIAVLEVLKEQTIYLHRQHGWLIAVAETVETNPELVAHLKQHPLYDQGPRPDIHITQRLTQKLDALIQQLKLQS